MPVEPGSFRTGFAGRGALRQTAAIPAYAATAGLVRTNLPNSDGRQEGDPDKAAAAILTVLAAEKTPLRLLLGNDATDAIHARLDAARAETLEWETVSRSTDFGDQGALAAGPGGTAHVLDRRGLDGPVRAATAPG
ncbi:hypothetical protein [Streptomyces sp. NPDC088246]|uniref:hypothetical protein n=1 Tax=Streptomyces sp. NPDC088246 TaxID=3365842 RepID=UPI003828F374